MKKTLKKLNKIRKKFFDEISGIGFSFDSFEGPSFIASALDILEDISTIIIEKYRLDFSGPEDVFNFLYSTRKVKADYSELYFQLKDWEDQIDYGELILSEEDEIDVQDVVSGMESMIEELIEIAENE